MRNKKAPLRQGDVTLVPVTEMGDLPKTERVRGRLVLAEGEVTGHAHGVTDRGANLYGTELETRFLEVLAAGGVALDHEEHDTIVVPQGLWEVRIGRVFEPAGIRRVSD